MKAARLQLCSFVILASYYGLTQSQNGPYFKPCSPSTGNTQNCHQDLGSTIGSCTKYCSNGPARFTPELVNVCEDEAAKMNARVDGDVLSTHGDMVIYSGLDIDWDDGRQSKNIDVSYGKNTNKNVEHAWVQATSYTPSLVYYVQHKYHGAGSCSYECRLPASTRVVVHQKLAPECRSGKYDEAVIIQMQQQAPTKIK
jgi:hypothetical protein